MGTFRIRVEQDTLKFSAAHFLLFAHGECEHVHGHNYRAWVEVEGSLTENDFVFDFTTLKPLVKKICDHLDHRVLLPTENEALQITQGDGVIEAKFQDKRYCFPAQDVVLLPIRNTTAELLARYISERLKEELRTNFGVENFTTIKVGVEESFGQEAFYEERF